MSVILEYAAAGWKLCAIEPGHKGPTYKGWNTKPLAAEAVDALGGGVGLLHALSGTCALDVDDRAKAAPWLKARGLDLEALLAAQDAVGVTSGRPGRAKLLYKLTLPLRTLKPADSGLELRCATADGKSVQDVLPPSVHPDTKRPYEWVYGDLVEGHWSRLPPIPQPLLGLWLKLAGGHVQAPPASAVAPVPAGTKTPDLARLKALLVKADPDMAYDPWLEIGMAFHDESGAHPAAFALWDEWSSRGKTYKGTEDLRKHWDSFVSRPGKRVVTVGALEAKQPAVKEEFPEAEDEVEVESTKEKLAKASAGLKEKAREKLEKRLAYVVEMDRYFDCERHALMVGDHAVEHMFTWMMPMVKSSRQNPVKVLRESGSRTFVDRLGFHPGEGVIFRSDGDSYANQYRNRLPEPLEPTAEERDKIDWLFDRLDDEVFRIWLKKFLGHVVQKPGKKIKSAPLIWSETQGNGKTTLLKAIPSLLTGKRYSKEVSCATLNSDFNDQLKNAWHVNLAEFRAGTRGERGSITEKLKQWIAEDTIELHPKGLPGLTMPNHFFLTATSNYDDAAQIDNEDRRWAIHEMHAKQFTEAEQAWIYDEFLLLPRAAAVLRHYFLNVDTSGFVASAKAPETEAKKAMAGSSISSDLEALQIAFEERSGLFAKDIVLVNEVKEFVHKHSPAKPSAERIGKMLRKAPFNGDPVQFRCGHGKYRAVVLHNKSRWAGAVGKDIMDHINSEELDITK